MSADTDPLVPFDHEWRGRPAQYVAPWPTYHTDSRADLGGAGSDLRLVHSLLRAHGFAPADGLADGWTIFWHTGALTPAEEELLPRLAGNQRWNKLPGSSALTVKTRLWETLRAAKQQHGGAAFEFVPESFVLPQEAAEFEATMRREAAHAHLWILKPASRQRGAGIFLHRAAEDRVASGCSWGAGAPGGLAPARVLGHVGVASRYIHPPLLLPGGYKFDLRLYVLVTCCHPLVAYVYDEGLARRAAAPYDVGDLDERASHLTNYSIGKHRRSTAAEAAAGAGVDGASACHGASSALKWSLHTLREWLRAERGVAIAARIDAEVDAVVAKTLVAAEPELHAGMHASGHPAAAAGVPCRNFFQLFGFDVMLDAELKAWLIEVNAGPSLATDAPLDEELKSAMLVDLMNVVGVPRTVASGVGGVSNATDEMERWAAASHPRAPPLPPEASPAHEASPPSEAPPAIAPAASDDADEEPVHHKWARHLLATELARARDTRWRRLLPAVAYAPMLSAERPLHGAVLAACAADPDRAAGECELQSRKEGQQCPVS